MTKKPRKLFALKTGMGPYPLALDLPSHLGEQLQRFVQLAFTPKAGLKHYNKDESRRLIAIGIEFAAKASEMLRFIDSCAISESKKEILINSFFIATSACQETVSVRHDAIERLRKELINSRTLKGRKKRANDKATRYGIIERLANILWVEKPWMERESAQRNAREIMSEVNAELEARVIKRVGLHAIRKQVSELLERLERTTVQ